MHVAPRISLTVSRREQAFVAIFIYFGSILFMINCRWGRHKRRRWMMAIKVWAVTSVVKLILWSWRQKRWWWKMVLDLSFEKHCKVPTFIFPLAKICTKSLKSSAGQSLSSGQSSANLKMVGNLQQRKWANPICKCSALRKCICVSVYNVHVAMQSIVQYKCSAVHCHWRVSKCHKYICVKMKIMSKCYKYI